MALRGFCLDTDILIDYLRGLEDARLFLLQTSERAPLFISIISIVELYSGKTTHSNTVKKHLETFLHNFNIIDLTPTLAKRAGELRRDYQGPFADMIVAASALEHKSILVTRNEKHFQNIKRLKLRKPY